MNLEASLSAWCRAGHQSHIWRVSMATETSDDLIIQGMRVNASLLETRPWRRCHLDECQGYCCGAGVCVSLAQVDDILGHASLFQPYMSPERCNPQDWFYLDETHEDQDHPAGGQYTYTMVFDDPLHPYTYACVFLRPDRKCALQLASIESGEHPWRYKPFYCALHPIEFNDLRVTLCEDNPIFKEGGGCHRITPDRSIPLYVLFADELKLALGEAGYTELAAQAAWRQTAGR
jgi:hypothetical protein